MVRPSMPPAHADPRNVDPDSARSPVKQARTPNVAVTCRSALDVHPKVVSQTLGHSQIDRHRPALCSHATVTMQQQAVTALDGLFRDL